jgi:adenylylsulfate kinase
MKILIMGLPDSGKTYLAERLQKHLGCAWFNADEVRTMTNDWEFNTEARIRQARRMRNLADYEKSEGRTVICDFVCPTQLTRHIFEADFTIWMNTVQTSRFEDTNYMFEAPAYSDLVIEYFLTDEEIVSVANKIAGVYI